MTRLDDLAQAMQSGQEAAAMRFYQALADSDLILLMDGDGALRPKVFELSDGPMILAYDEEERLSATHGVASYAAMPGRVLAQQMLGQGVSVGLNLGSDAASEMVLPPEALRWLCDMLERDLQVEEAAVLGFSRSSLSDGFVDSLKVTMAGAAGLVSTLGLVAATMRGATGNRVAQEIVVIFGAPAEAEVPLARSVSEVASFAGLSAESVAVQFLADPAAAPQAMMAVMQMVQLPQPQPASSQGAVKAPGTDPDRPPRLR